MGAKHIVITFALLLSVSNLSYAREDLSTFKRQMIRESISQYPGNCACPYQLAANGSSCGRRSAYDRPGGYAPLCFEGDISDSEARAWSERRR